MALFNRAEEWVFKAQKCATVDLDSEKLKNDLERVTNTWENAGNGFTKALDASIDTIGTGSGHVMVLLPSRIADGTKQK